MSRRYTIRLICSTLGDPTEHDGRYVVEFVPARMDSYGRYLPGGKLVTSEDVNKAQRFPDAALAWEFWRSSAGYRPDGRPNRPLTAWCADIAPEPNA